ncbi:uncharacterized protein LOC143187676 [Calliopsis andreniformis]|uniref:uncharacterized protein LOC143187676 n=1 Tax=Calliopsis andreniformis TaxID=337506 RepID=UPI003FCC8967
MLRCEIGRTKSDSGLGVTPVFTKYNGIGCNDEDLICGEGFVGTNVENIVMISAYISPNSGITKFCEIVKEIVKIRRANKDRFSLMGDLNAKQPAWGSDKTNSRGNILLEAHEDMRLVPIITDGGHTFEKNSKTSKIDIISCDVKTLKEVKISKVIEQDLSSDHKYVTHVIRMTENSVIDDAAFRPWSFETFNEERFIECLDAYLVNNETPRTSDCMMSFGRVCETLRATLLTCGESMKRKSIYPQKRRANPWWNIQISEKRKNMNAARRRFQRARKKQKTNWQVLEKEHKEKRKVL